MTKDYVKFTRSTAKYPGALTGNRDELSYLALGLTGEAGELANKVKKLLRGLPGDPDIFELSESLKSELGDVLWYLTRLIDACDSTPKEIMLSNVAKLSHRKEAGKIGGSGDTR